MSAIVTCANSRIAYNVVRSLGRKGIGVYTSDFVPRAMSFVSRYSQGNFVYPSPFTMQKDFVECLIRTIEKLKTDVLIPVFEETFLVAKFRESFAEVTKLVVPEYENILFAHNKDQWAKVALSLGIPVPESYDVDFLRNGGKDFDVIRYPVLIKPKQGGGAWGICEAASEKKLKEIISKPNNNGVAWHRFFVQQKISGQNLCVAMLFRLGQLRAMVSYRQLRDYPLTGGQATLRISIRNEAAESALESLLEAVNWHGICQADFVFDEKTGRPYLIDLNPRFWGSLTQAIASGVNFPYLLYRMALDGDVAPQKEFKTGVVTRWLGGDLRTFLPHIRASRDKSRAIWRFFLPGVGKVYYDDWSLDDPLPFLSWSADVICRALKYRTLKPVTHESLAGIWE